MKRSYLLLLLTLLFGPLMAQENCTTYEEQNGLVVFEVESKPAPNVWDFRTNISGFKGSGFYFYDGPDRFNDPGTGTINYNVRINTPGLYRIQMRSRIAISNNPTEHNDVWIKFPNNDNVVFFGYKAPNNFSAPSANTVNNAVNNALDNNSGNDPNTIVFPKGAGFPSKYDPEGGGKNGWFKAYQNQTGVWSRQTRTSDNDPHFIYARFNQVGTYTFQVSGRSNGHAIDRFVMYQSNITENQAFNASQSPCQGDATPDNQAPTANAGPNRTITLPTNSTTLNGSNSFDSDGEIAAYLWTKLSGPAASLQGVNAPSLSLSNLQEGIYTFRLRVTDNDGAVDTDNVTVTVNAAPVVDDQALVSFTLINVDANSEAGQIVSGTTIDYASLGTSNINVRANTDPITVGSVVFELNGNEVRTENVAPYALYGDINQGETYRPGTLEPGSYTLTATPYTNSGGNGTAGTPLSVSFTVVNGTQNTPPVANAGDDKTLTLPTNSTTLDGGASSDSDGSIVAYQWTKIQGPAATLQGANTPTLSLSNLVEGSYVFRLRVTDNDGATDADNVSVAVDAEPTSGFAVTSFTLVNADDGTDIGGLTEGASFNYDNIGTSNINVRANVSGTVESVIFVLNGQEIRTENIAPYALYGDVNEGQSYLGSTLPAGNYALTATPYSANKGAGDAGVSLTVNFQIVDGDITPSPDAIITSFTLINTNNNEALFDVEEGTVINYADINTNSVTIRAEIANGIDVTRVIFDFNGTNNFQVENIAPYVLDGDINEGAGYIPVNFPEGANTVTARAFVGDQQVDSKTVNFTVQTGGGAGAGFGTTAANAVSIYPNPTEGALNVEIPVVAEGAVTVAIYDLRGALVHQQTITAEAGATEYVQVADRTLAPGLYLCRVITPEGTTVVKVTKQ